MLKYSVVPRKSPINGEIKYYSQLAATSPITLAEIADNISNLCTVTIHDVKAVLSALEEQIYSALRDGNSVRLGDLGSFHPTLGCKGKATAKEFTAADITNVRVRFSRSSKMAHELSITNPKVKFVQVASVDVPVSPAPQEPGSSGDVSPETGKGGSEI